jgi:hypothetical protein
MRLQLSIAAVLLAVAACGTASGGSLSRSDVPKDKLLAVADRAAEANGGKARYVEAVATTRGTAADLTGHSNQNQDEQVWVVQVSGDNYACNVCSRPFGATAPSGKYLTIVLRASDFQSTDSGIGPGATDLSKLGEVEVLRDDR